MGVYLSIVGLFHAYQPPQSTIFRVFRANIVNNIINATFQKLSFSGNLNLDKPGCKNNKGKQRQYQNGSHYYIVLVS